jgi:threonine dehydratase
MNNSIEPTIPIIQEIKSAANNIKGIAFRTPLYRSERLSREFDANIFLKLECYQPTRTFKIRGATNKILLLSKTERNHGVVAASSGNHGLAVAYVANLLGINATVVVPKSAVREKVEAIKEQRATVVEFGRSHPDRFQHALCIQRNEGAALVHPFDDPIVIAGQGTIGLEILEDLPDVDAVIVPVGGGGLISGVSLAVKAQRRGARIYGVQSDQAASMYQSLKTGKPTMLNDTHTIADGLAPGQPGELTFHITKENVDSILLTSEESIRSATRTALESLHLMIEPSAAAAIAVLGEAYKPRKDENVVLIISAGNISMKLLRELLND